MSTFVLGYKFNKRPKDSLNYFGRLNCFWGDEQFFLNWVLGNSSGFTKSIDISVYDLRQRGSGRRGE